MTEQRAIQVGDRVRLKAGSEPMTVAAVRAAGDGTSHDGVGLLCLWYEDNTLCRAWLSASSVEPAADG